MDEVGLAGTGRRSSSSRQGCSGREKGRKLNIEPLGGGVADYSLARDRALRACLVSVAPDGHALIESVEGAWSLALVSANPARAKQGSGPAVKARQTRRLPGHAAGRHARARGAASSFAPSADRRRASAANWCSSSDGAMPHEETVTRLQGRKTLASLPGSWPRERPPREGESDDER